MDNSSKLRSILITGCSSGIGLCLTHGLRSEGYRVFATARQSDDVDKLKALGFESLLLVSLMLVALFFLSTFLVFFFKQKTAYEVMPSLVGSEMCL